MQQKYEGYINIEICTWLQAVKYINEYIYKGFDCADMMFTEEKGTTDEIDNYINARYVSVSEAMWQLLTFKMHDRLQNVTRLPKHLPN